MSALAEIGLSPWVARVLAALWGFLWGSFLNVVIYRVPREISIVRPGSHCPACGAAVKVIDNIPLLSWVLLRGKARCCGVGISPRYPVVELLGGAIGLAIAELVFRGASEDVPVLHSAIVFLADFALAMSLLAAAFIDAAHMYLPDGITIGGTLVGLATSGLRELTFRQSLFGALAGFLGIWLPLILGYKALRGRAGMGLGDAKLVMLAGAWYGWPGAVFALFAGAFQATVAAGAMLLIRGKIEEPEAVRKERKLLQQAAEQGDTEAMNVLEKDPLADEPGEGLMAARLPFGPFLCLATIEWMLAGEWIREYAPWLNV